MTSCSCIQSTTKSTPAKVWPSPKGYDCLDKTRARRVVTQDLPYLSDGGIDCVFGINVDLIAPKLLNDLLSPDQFARPAGQQNQEFHRDPLELQLRARPPQPMVADVEFKFSEL